MTVTGVNLITRRISGNDSSGRPQVFKYNDETLVGPAGGQMTLDTWHNQGHSTPFKVGDHVRVWWRISTDGKTHLAVGVNSLP